MKPIAVLALTFLLGACSREGPVNQVVVQPEVMTQAVKDCEPHSGLSYVVVTTASYLDAQPYVSVCRDGARVNNKANYRRVWG